MKYASFGFQIEHLNEFPGISSPDVALVRHGYTVRVNGRLADLKRLSSANNIFKEGKDAIYKKGADIVMYEFTGHFRGLTRALEKLKIKNIHGYYYFSDGHTYYSF